MELDVLTDGTALIKENTMIREEMLPPKLTGIGCHLTQVKRNIETDTNQFWKIKLYDASFTSALWNIVILLYLLCH